mmetsp:Transcript_19097/g.21580  ORF Transcript_19097/g.21580 Transcript_19097/m.21580 type:complete len:1376 (+) Transcript_19097:201-4328(+)
MILLPNKNRNRRCRRRGRIDSNSNGLSFLFTTAIFSLSSVLLLLLPLLFCHAELLLEPSLKWSVQLEGSGRLRGRGLRKGNAIVAYKDGTKIFVTANDGSLHIIQTTTTQVNTLAIFTPDEIQGRFTECRSGATVVDKNIAVATGEDNNGNNFDTTLGLGVEKEDYIIYAVLDSTVPSVNVGLNSVDDIVSSRVIAVNLDGTYKWSVQIEGRVEGNPVVGKSGIFVSHNSDNGIGYLSVIRIDPDNGSANIVATVSPRATQPGNVNGPFGPPALQQRSYEDEYLDDVVVVAENWDQGYSEDQGGLYMLTLDTTDDESFTLTSGYLLQKISSYSHSAFAPPLVYGDSIFLGSAGGTLAGFTGGRKNNLSGILSGREEEIDPRWRNEVTPNPRVASQPLWSQPINDSKGDYLLIPGVDSDFYCFQSDNGRELWRDEEGSQIMTRPHIWEGDNPVVYVVESLNGRVRQYDLYSGERNWDYSCADISDKLCQDAVEAEFAITPNGNTVYYGDIYGRINSLEVANFTTKMPTIAPTSITTVSPTLQPPLTSSPFESPVTASTTSPTASPTTVPVMVEEPQNAIVTTTASPTHVTEPIGGDIPVEEIQQQQDEDNDMNEVEGIQAEVNTNDTDQVTAIINKQEAKKEEKPSDVALYIGVAIAALCALMIPIVIFSFLRGRKKRKPTKINHMMLEINDDSDSDDPESQVLDSSRSADFGSGGDGGGIEIEFKHSDTSPQQGTPTKKKKKRKKKRNLPDTPQTAQTLESIEELPEESIVSGNSAMVVMGDDGDIEDPSIEAVNLRRRFDNVIDDQRRSEENGSSVAPGEAGMATGSNHLELAIGMKNNLTRLCSGEPEDLGKHINADPSDDESLPPPPPSSSAPVSISNSSTQWTWSSLLQIGTSQTVKKVNNNPPTLVKTTSERLELKESSRVIDPATLSQDRSNSTTVENQMTSSSSTQNQAQDDASSDVGSWSDVSVPFCDTAQVTSKEKKQSNSRSIRREAHVPSPDVSETDINSIHRAETPPITNQKIDSDEFTNDIFIGHTPPKHGIIIDTDQKMPTRISKEIPEKVTRDNGQPTEQDAILREKEIHSSTVEDAEEEKKEGEQCYSRPQTPIQTSKAPVSPSVFSMMSDTAHSSLFGSHHHSPSNASISSNDDSLYTSMTGMSGKKEDPKDLSPLSTHVFDKDIHRRGRSELTDDADNTIKGILTQPDLSKSNDGYTDKFRYLDEEEDAPDDEKSVAPGIQYMSKLTEEKKSRKYGKSVRSKRESNIGFRSSTSSREESGIAPLAQMYNQLASMGQQKEEERKHVYKRRSKRVDKEESSVQLDQESGENWGSFLNELAEAEKHFYNPSSNINQSLLNSNSDSEESDDAEIARINNFS